MDLLVIDESNISEAKKIQAKIFPEYNGIRNYLESISHPHNKIWQSLMIDLRKFTGLPLKTKLSEEEYCYNEGFCVNYFRYVIKCPICGRLKGYNRITRQNKHPEEVKDIFCASPYIRIQ